MAVTTFDSPLESVDVPEPDLPEGSVLLQVLTCGVCYSDVKTSRGLMPHSDRLLLPHIPGHEICGRVVESRPVGLVPKGALGIVYHYWPCGQCRACVRGDETLCSKLAGWIGFTEHGGFRERIAVPADRLILIPEDTDPVLAAPMTCALGTAYRSVVTRGGVRGGSSVAILGLGGVGIHAAQVARAVGAGVIGLDTKEATLQAARELGLDACFSEETGVAEAVFSETGGEGVDVVVDTVGQDRTLALADHLVRKGGRIVAVGYLPSTGIRLEATHLVLDEIELMGSRYAHRDDIERVVRMVAHGLVTPVVTLVRPLTEANVVLEALASGEVVGRAVLDVAGVAESKA